VVRPKGHEERTEGTSREGSKREDLGQLKASAIREVHYLRSRAHVGGGTIPQSHCLTKRPPVDGVGTRSGEVKRKKSTQGTKKILDVEVLRQSIGDCDVDQWHFALYAAARGRGNLRR